MKQKISITWLSARLAVFCLLVYVPQQLSAQEDSVRIILNNKQINPTDSFGLLTSDFSLEKVAIPSLNPSMRTDSSLNISLEREIHLPYYTNPSPLFKGDYNTGGVLRQFRHGVLYGSGDQTSVPGIGRFNNASIGYQHALSDRFTLELGVNAMKINMPFSTGQAFSTSGALLYHPSERITLKVFGSYDIGNSHGMSTKLYGASVAFDMSERFGMEVGVQRYYNAMSGRWETVPMVIPYFRFNKTKLGLDVGGILYEILHNAVYDKKPLNNPTFGPPRLDIPIRPR